MRLSPIMAMALFCTCFAVFFTLQQCLLRGGIHPLHLNMLCYFIASATLSSYLLVKDRQTFVIKSKKGLVLGIGVGLAASIFADLLVLYGLQIGSPITWSLLLCSAPLVTYVLAIPFLREVVKVHKVAALIISIIGALLVIYVPKIGLDLQHGAIFFFAAIVFYGVGNILSQLALNYITPMQLTWVKLCSTALILIIIVPFLHLPFHMVNLGIVVANSFVMLCANILANYVIGKAGATYFSIGNNMAPLFVSLLSIVTIGVWPTWLQIVGGVVIVSGILLFQKVQRSQSTPELTL